MSLVELVDNNRTDKNTTHSYLGLYEDLLHLKKETARNILEIGIGQHYHANGGSIKLWHDYFPNAQVYAVDILPLDNVYDGIKNNERIHLYTSSDSYQREFFDSHLSHIIFDMILDDGPHTLESQKMFIELYSGLLCDDGILIIEDIQSYDWFETLKSCVPDELKQFIEIYDLRHVKGRYDDLVFVINKSK